jgi:hypothetical protein
MVLAACGSPSPTSPRAQGGNGSKEWTLLPNAPIGPRADSAMVWTGSELVIWGGEGPNGPVGDGAAYNPQANRWRQLSPSPLSARLGASAVWAGSKLLIWGGHARDGQASDGAAYDPSHDSWEPLPPSPLSPRSEAPAVWTGQEMFVWGGIGEVPAPVRVVPNQGFQTPPVAAAAYNLRTRTWRALTASRFAGMEPFWKAAWTGSAMVVTGGPAPPSPPSSPGAPVRAASYDPARDTWVSFGDAPLPPARVVPAATDDSVVLVADTAEPGAAGAAILRDGAWTAIASPAAAIRAQGASSAQWTGAEVLVWCGSGVALKPATRTWRQLPQSPLLARTSCQSVWTGDELITWGGWTNAPAGTTTPFIALTAPDTLRAPRSHSADLGPSLCNRLAASPLLCDRELARSSGAALLG